MTTLTPEHFETSIDNLYDAVMISQCKGGNPVVYINQSFTDLTGYVLDDIVEKPFDDIFVADGEDDTSSHELNTLKACMKNRTSSLVSLAAYKKDGSSFYAQVSISQFKNSRGRTTHYMSIIRDVSTNVNLEKQLFAENSKLYDEIQQLKVGSKYDLATGLLNRSALSNEVKGLFSGAKRAEEFFTLFFIGVNDFQNLSGTVEKIEIDSILQQLGGLLQSTLKRESDIIFKYSESEFVICFTGQNQHNSRLFANKLKELVAKQMFADSHKISVSIGVSCDIPSKDSSTNQALLAADLNMHSSRLQQSA